MLEIIGLKVVVFAIASSSSVSSNSIIISSSSNSSTCCCQLKIIQHQAKVWVEHLSQRDSAGERDDTVRRIGWKRYDWKNR